MLKFDIIFVKNMRVDFTIKSIYSDLRSKRRMPSSHSKDKIERNTIEYYYGIPFEGSTSQGRPLRRLANITCPYTGVKMIQGKALKGFEKHLAECENAQDVVNLLSGFAQYFQKTEKSIFAIFKDFALLNPKDNLKNCLEMIYNNCLKKLKLEEFMVLDDVDMISRKLSMETAYKLRAKTTRCREIIIENKEGHTFKRKTFLESLEEIEPKHNERDILESIKDRSLFLPTSGSSKNAFVVKYSTRSQEEMARRLFLASTATIEHVVPASKGGSNHIGNFLLASANGNRYRENLPLQKYINRYPDIPKYCQQYMDDIINAIHDGELYGNEDYPYMIKQTLIKESGGRLAVSLSKYKYTEEEAFKVAEEHANAKKMRSKK